MSIFTCCERLDESKYLHTCACPSAGFTCESEEIVPSLIGWQEVDDGTYSPSTPPVTYLKISGTGSGLYNGATLDCCGTDYVRGTNEWTGSETCELDQSETKTCSGEVVAVYHNYRCVDCDVTETSSGSDSVTGADISSLGFTNWWDTYTTTSATSGYFLSNFSETDPRRVDVSLDPESIDTEANAILRATPTTGSSCSSRWESRDTEYSWIKRTAGYTIECSNLVAGLSYKVYPIIQKRPVTDNSDGTWEPVTVAPVTINPTGTTYTLDDSGSPIQLDHIQGREYQIIDVNIEKA